MATLRPLVIDAGMVRQSADADTLLVGALTANGMVTGAHLKDTTLTAGRVVYASAGGQLADSANLTFAAASGLSITGNLGVGAATSPYGNSGHEFIINLERTWTDTTTGGYAKEAIQGLLHWNPGTGGGSIQQYVVGGYFAIDTTATETVSNTGYLMGSHSGVLHRSGSTIHQVFGIRTQVGTYNSGSDTTGVIDELYGFACQGFKTASSTIATAYGIYISGFAAGTAYDIYAADSGAKNYLAGRTSVGTLNVVEMLTVGGNIWLGAGGGAAGYVRVSEWSNCYAEFGYADANGGAYAQGMTNGAAGNLVLNPSGGKVGVGVAAPTAALQLKPGTAAASTAPLKFTSGTLLSSAEVGAMEFNSDDLLFTITTGAARQKVVLTTGLTSGRVPCATTNGRLTDSGNLNFDGTNLAIGAAASPGDELFIYSLPPGSYNSIHARQFARLASDGASSNYVVYADCFSSIASGRNDSGTCAANAGFALRHIDTVSDGGTLQSLMGNWFQVGHYTYANTRATSPVTTSAYGVKVNPYAYSGTITNFFGLYLDGAGTISTPSAWTATTTCSLSDIRRPTVANGKYYICTRAGTSGASEPTWATTLEATVDDPDTNGVQWTCIAIPAIVNHYGVYQYDATAVNVFNGPMQLLGKTGIGVTSPTAALHLKGSTSAAGTAPLKFTSGTLLSSAEAGAVEFNSDDLYFTITTGTTRKKLALTEGLTSGRVPYATTNGRLTDSAVFRFNGAQLTAPLTGAAIIDTLIPPAGGIFLFVTPTIASLAMTASVANGGTTTQEATYWEAETTTGASSQANFTTKAAISSYGASAWRSSFTISGNAFAFMGTCDTSVRAKTSHNFTDSHVGFIYDNGTWYASVADGAGQSVAILGDPPDSTDSATFKMDGSAAPGQHVYFYINGVQVADLTTNIPSGIIYFTKQQWSVNTKSSGVAQSIYTYTYVATGLG